MHIMAGTSCASACADLARHLRVLNMQHVAHWLHSITAKSCVACCKALLFSRKNFQLLPVTAPCAQLWHLTGCSKCIQLNAVLECISLRGMLLTLSPCLQLGFFNIVGIPLFKSFAELFPEAQPMLDGVMSNFKHWEQGTAMEDLPN